MKVFFSVIIVFFALGQIFSQIDDKEAVLKKKAEGTGDSSKTWKAPVLCGNL